MSPRHSMVGRRSVSFDPSPPSVYTPFLRRFTDESARDLNETIALYREVRRTHQKSVWAEENMIDQVNGHCAEIIRNLTPLPDYKPLLEALDRCQKALIAQESTILSFPEIDWGRAHLSMKEHVDLRRFLRAKQHFLANQERVSELLVHALCNVCCGIIQSLPALPDEDEPRLSVPLISLLPKPAETIDSIIATLMTEPLVNA